MSAMITTEKAFAGPTESRGFNLTSVPRGTLLFVEMCCTENCFKRRRKVGSVNRVGKMFHVEHTATKICVPCHVAAKTAAECVSLFT